MKKAKDFRLLAAQKNNNYTGTLAVTALIVYAFLIIAGLAEISTVGAIIISIVMLVFTGPFMYGIILMIKKVDECDSIAVVDLFSAFKSSNTFFRMFVIELLVSIFTFLWTLLLIIPGIIKSLSYAMTMFIAIDNPNMTETECITKSREMMNGNKWRLFCLEISYIGWAILCSLTLGILSLWVAPKFIQAHYQFYLDIKGNKPIETEQVLQK